MKTKFIEHLQEQNFRNTGEKVRYSAPIPGVEFTETYLEPNDPKDLWGYANLDGTVYVFDFKFHSIVTYPSHMGSLGVEGWEIARQRVLHQLLDHVYGDLKREIITKLWPLTHTTREIETRNILVKVTNNLLNMMEL